MGEAVRRWISRVGVAYLVLCELALGGPLGYEAVSYLIRAMGTQNEMHWFDGLGMAVCSFPCLAAGYGLVRRKSWAWYLSLFLGFAVLVLGISFIRSSFSPDPYNRMEGGLIFGTGLYLAVASMVGVVMAVLPPVRRYCLRKG